MATYITTAGTVLKIGDASSPIVFTTIPQVVSIDGPTASNDEIEVTHLGSTAKEFVGSLPDYGSLNLEIEWDERDTVHAGMRTDFAAATVRPFQLIDAASPMTTYSVSGFIKSLPLSFAANDVVRSNAEIRLTGAFTAA